MLKSVKPFLLFSGIVLIALAVRLSDYAFWQIQQEDFYIDNEPLILTVDGYYYLTLADLWIQGKYKDINKYRTAPTPPELPGVIPLLSYMTAIMSEGLGLSLNTSAFYLTLLLPLLTLIPIYYLAAFYGGRNTGILAALFLSLSTAFAFRSSIGWYDTDILNLFFLLWVVTSCAGFAIEPYRKKIYYLFSCCLATFFWMWWWNTLKEIVFLFAMLSLMISILSVYRPRIFKSEFLAFTLISAVVATGLMILVPEILAKMWFHVEYLLKRDEVGLDSPGLEVAEQRATNIDTLIRYSFGSYLGLIVFFYGLVKLLMNSGKRSILLLGLASFSMFSFFAQRYLMFLAPVAALTMAYAIVELWKLRLKKSLFYMTPLLALIIIFQLAGHKYKVNLEPLYKSPVVEGIQSIKDHSPEESIIWAWWDQGYLIHFWAKRATISDGSAHTSERNTYNALPLLSNDFRFAANFMVFYSENGMVGINKNYFSLIDDRHKAYDLLQKILSAGPDQSIVLIKNAQADNLLPVREYRQWKEFFFPEQQRPIYLFIDQHSLSVVPGMLKYISKVSKNIREKEFSEPFIPIYDIEKATQNKLKAWNNINVDLQQGKISIPNTIRLSQYHATSSKVNINDIPFSRLRIKGVEGMTSMENNRPEKYTFDWNRETNTGLLSGQILSESVIARLFIFGEADSQYFIPVLKKSSDYQIWEVRGDSAGRY